MEGGALRISRPLITELLNRREIESDVRDNGREMSERKTWLGVRGLRVVPVSFPGGSALISRLLVCSGAAHGAHSFGHMKSISRSLRGTPSPVFIGTEVTKTVLLNSTPLAEQLRKHKHICN